jgi:hypothetical protein
MNATKIAHRLRDRIGRFSGDVSAGLGVVAQRFVAEMLYGIQASESVMLTEIGRTLEEPIALKKTHGRLSRNLQRPELERVVQNNVTRMASRHVTEDTLLILDPSDLSKKYAKKMEYLARVRDGSAQDFANGYWMVHVMGTQVDSDAIIPLYQRLYSAQAPDFESENQEVLRAIDAVGAHVGRRGLWVMDRGGDRINLFEPILDRQFRFLFRLVGNRHLVSNGKTMLASDVAARCPCPHSHPIVKVEQGCEVAYHLDFGFRKVYLPERPEPLYLLVVRGLGHEPLLLLTNEPLRKNFQLLWGMVRAYFKRWAIEETIRYIKTCYDLENVRVLNYKGLQNLLPLVLAVIYFAACVLDHDARLRLMAQYVEHAAKRVFGIPDFKYYALADGLRSLFVRHPGSPRTRIRPPTHVQLPLFTDPAT